ncbi:SubName: Full=Uncharacterized protein {ECO:0000313/EMBL:CCA77008.1} [Serendipita indica DSM 11827]|nr:SubName: Full=Uncharacterized protein {ECO:0000313/EMBL:CCA77008.1} [Serendipita indica DSM 11827]
MTTQEVHDLIKTLDDHVDQCREIAHTIELYGRTKVPFTIRTNVRLEQTRRISLPGENEKTSIDYLLLEETASNSHLPDDEARWGKLLETKEISSTE